MILEDQIALITNPLEFTRLCNSIFTCIYGESDFQVVDGTRGDEGNDGYVRSEKRLFAIYSPIKPERRTDKDYIDKIKSDMQKASVLHDKNQLEIERWTFVTPRKLSNKVILEMEKLGVSHKFATNHIESTFLSIAFNSNPQLLRLFPNLCSPYKGLLRSFSDVMEIDPENINPLLDWPIIVDMKSGERSELYFDEDKVMEIDQILTNQQKRRILVKGLGGRGKTVLCRMLAYSKVEKGWQVKFADIREVGSSENGVETIINEIENSIKSSKNSILIIFENAHLYDDITFKLVTSSDNWVNNKDFIDSHFLFTSRDVVKDEDLNPFSNWKKKGFVSVISPDTNLIENIVTKFIKANNMQYALSPADRDWIEAAIKPTVDSSGLQDGGDLRLLRLYLIAWKYKSTSSLRDLKEQDITKSLKQFLLVDELSRNPALADLLGKVSCVFQFDVPFYGRRTGWSDSKDYIIDLESLINKGKIKYIGADFYTLTHSRDAFYITRCLADHYKQTHSQYTGSKIIEYICELPKQPANLIVNNLVQLFRAFFDNQQEFTKDVFVYIFSNARNKIIEIINEYCEGLGTPGQNYHEGLGILSRILNLIEIYLGKFEAYCFWVKVCEHIKPEAWYEIFIRNRPFYIALLIQIIDRIAPDAEPAHQKFKFLFDNFEEIFKRSELHRLTEIFRPLPPSVVNMFKDKMDTSLFASKVIESKPIYFEFMLKQLDDDFVSKVLIDLKNEHWDGFIAMFKKFEDKKYPKTLIDRIRAVDAGVANDLRRELRDFFEDLKIQNRKRNPAGRLVIDNKIANNYANINFSNDDFRKHLHANFEQDFVITINNAKIAERLISKIYYSTYKFPEKEKSREIICQIMYQLPKEVLAECFSNNKLLKLIEKASDSAYEYLWKECMDFG